MYGVSCSRRQGADRTPDRRDAERAFTCTPHSQGENGLVRMAGSVQRRCVPRGSPCAAQEDDRRSIARCVRRFPARGPPQRPPHQPSIDVVDHDDRDVPDACKCACQSGDRPGIVVKGPAKPNGLPGHDADACVATTTGAPEQAPKGPIQAPLTASRSGCRKTRLQPFPSSPAQSPELTRWRTDGGIRRHSTPIATVIGEAA